MKSQVADDTWIVIPLFNEGPVIRGVVQTVLEKFDKVVCVDDGSTDDSAAEAAAGGAIVVQHPINLGAGAAIRTGLDYALQDPTARHFVTFDADGQHQVGDAIDMVARLDVEGLDIIIGSRFLDDRTKPGTIKKAVLRTAVLFERLSTGIQLTDAHCGLRALNRRAATLIEITQNRMAHATEIVAEISRHDLAYAEHPVHILYTDYSRAKGQSVWNSVNIISDLFVK
ncbi:glycosyltransferase family 2 protein [Aeromicrobium wangtongii]|uniref:glycosyltransferase family 2 protein n=1 Tax=Aeromicrobium wangtongii TaxID=2969247 RepID=UPI0020179F04|nr:glycosyltransferase family 2 protein [Aeromicrobium wangtongii]MCL3817333.1 glycosyltransferase family 2 protein [Aeromicrobium wangtongii]